MTDAQLQALVALADAGSFTQAATRLRLSQSAVSHAIAGLEASLKVTLVRRVSQGVQLTEIGERIAQQARQVVQLKAQIRDEADASRRLQRGTLRIGSFGISASRHLLPPILDAFAERHPGIDVLITEGTDDEVVQWLREGAIDVGFVVLPADDFDTLLLAEDEMLLLVREDHPLAVTPRVEVAKLGGYPFIMASGGCEPRILEAAAGVTLDVRYRMREAGTIVSMVERGMGISVKPCLAVPHPLPAGVVALPLDPTTMRRVALAVRRRDAAPPACRAFLDVARAVGCRPPARHSTALRA